MVKKDFQVAPRKARHEQGTDQTKSTPLKGQEVDVPLDEPILRKRPKKFHTVTKSIKMPEEVSKRLKYYSLVSGHTEMDIVASLVTKELDRLQVHLPEEMRD